MTKTSAPWASAFAKTGSFAVSSLWKRTFSSSSTCPGCSSATSSSTFGPTQSGARVTCLFSSRSRRLRTGASENPWFTTPLGRPRCEATMMRAPSSMQWLIVGSAARMRVSSTMLWFSSRGTLKSTRIRTSLPLTGTSSTVSFCIMPRPPAPRSRPVSPSRP